MTQATTSGAHATVTRRAPNDLAVSITGRPYISWSQINCMRRCPQQFDFKYVRQAKPDFLPESLKFGRAIHAAVETFFRGQMEGITLSAPELLQAYRLDWTGSEEGDVPVKYNKGQDASTLFDLAGRILPAFLASPLALSKGRIIAIEETVSGTIDPDLPDVLARVDKVDLDGDGLHVIDFKTSRSRWDEAKAAESAEQLLLYRHLLTGLARSFDRPVHLSFGVLTKAKNPVAQYLAIPDQPGQMDRVLETIRQVWTAISAGNFYPNPQPMNCSTCPYKGRCPAFNAA